MNKQYRIYDDRTYKTFFKGSWFECASLLSQVDEESDAFPHLWIEPLKVDSNE